jgi:drug/metabolite transporter (DMT)-like permease
VLATPFLVLPAIWFAPSTWQATNTAWLGFLYVALFSQYLAFLPWFKGLSLGGIARVGQAQLLQPFVTIIASAWLLGEVVDWVTWAFAIAVFAVVALGRMLGAKR